MIFRNSKVYDVLKWIAQVGCYALIFAWSRLAAIWGFPYAQEIAETIAVLGVTIGILIGISGLRYSVLANSGEVEQVLDDETIDDPDLMVNTEEDFEDDDDETEKD